MAYTDTIFNDYGKIPTDSNFWNQSIDQFVSDSGFTSGFRRVLGEQVFKSNKEIRTPFYSRFAGNGIPKRPRRMPSDITILRELRNPLPSMSRCGNPSAFLATLHPLMIS